MASARTAAAAPVAAGVSAIAPGMNIVAPVIVAAKNNYVRHRRGDNDVPAIGADIANATSNGK
jgi:hypothetical protein